MTASIGTPVTYRTGEPFFFAMGIALLAIVLGGFVPLALARPGGVGGMPLLLHLHGAAFVGWFVLFCMQARLAASGKLHIHKQLGAASIVLAAAMIVLGFLVTRGAYARPDWTINGLPPASAVMFPFTDIVNFTIGYTLALAMRPVPDAHKRLMLITGILIIDPAAARLAFTLGGGVPLILGLELALFVALFAYDIVTRRRPHWATWLGLGLFIAAMVAKLTLSSSSAWTAFVERLFG